MVRSYPRLLSVVVPVYNEAANLPALFAELEATLGGYTWELIAVDDHSSDGSFELLRSLAERDPRVRALRLSRNRGQQIALACGLDHANGDVVVTLDADLQHPPRLIPEMVARWREGFDVVAMVKTGTEGRAVVKVVLADLFYRVFNTLSEVSVASGSSDFRLLDRRCVLALRSMPERRRFLRGLTRWIGFEQIELPYEAPVRHAGRPQYTLRRLAGLAGTGFLSFSAPLRLGIPLGAATLLVALGLGATFLLSPELARRPLTVAWVVPLLAVGGLLLFGLGVLGAYVAVLLDEARRRPLYFISDSVNIELAHDR